MTTENTQYVYDQINGLTQEAENWEEDELRRSNEVLYQLLSKCMKLALEITENRKLQTQLNAVLDNFSVRVTTHTPLMTKVIKLVFGTERRRASAYSLALRVAKKANVTPEELPEWLTKQGGVEEVRTASTEHSGVSAKELRICHRTAGESQIDGLTPLVTVAKSAGTPEAVGPTLMLGSVKADRTTEVMCFVNSETLVNAALEFVGKQAESDSEDGSDAGGDAVDAALDAVIPAEETDDQMAA